MARDEAPPFEPGQTYHGGTPTAQEITDSTHLEGKEWVFEDLDYSQQGAKPLRSGRKVTRRVVRNTTGTTIPPKKLCTFEADGSEYGRRVDGQTNLAAERGFPSDEFLPTAGVAINDLFYITVRGPAMCKLPLAGSEFGGLNIASGDKITAITCAASTNTTAGRVKKQAALAAATSGVVDFSDLFAEAVDYVGHALSAATSGNTDSDLLVDVGRW